jgi:hypothetical protein
MNDISQGYAQILLDILNDALCDAITFCREAKYLPGSDPFGPCSSDTANGSFCFRILDRKTNHRTRNRLRRRNSFEMSEAATRTLRAILFDPHMSYLTCQACRAMINLAIQDHTTADTASKSYVQYIALTGACSTLYFCQGDRIGIVINYTRYIKLLFKILLQGEIIPPVRMVQRVYHAMDGIYQSPNSYSHAQDAPILQPSRSSYLSEHIINQSQDGFRIGNILKRMTRPVQ